jgi:hypothetical protein
MLEGYYSVKKNLSIENITFSLLKALPHDKYWWEIYWERHDGDESIKFMTRPT